MILVNPIAKEEGRMSSDEKRLKRRKAKKNGSIERDSSLEDEHKQAQEERVCAHTLSRGHGHIHKEKQG